MLRSRTMQPVNLGCGLRCAILRATVRLLNRYGPMCRLAGCCEIKRLDPACIGTFRSASEAILPESARSPLRIPGRAAMQISF